MIQPSHTQFKVIAPGLFTTIQDQGRFGYQRFGVPLSGVLDSFSANIANQIVGNNQDAALLEISLQGPRLYILHEAIVAVTGAEIPIKLNGEYISTWKAFRVRTGDTLVIGDMKKGKGCRAYLAVTGGLAVPSIMGSKSCYVGGRFGGGFGRPLMAGDKLKRFARPFPQSTVALPPAYRPSFTSDIVLRAIPGPQDDFFSEGLDLFFNADFVVSPDSNRVGCRLLGPRILQKPEFPQSIISEPSLPGGVQIPPNGNPIVLLSEQTVGGYSKIATVISSDIKRIAQAAPGDRIRFKKISLEEAYAIKRDESIAWEKIQSEMQTLLQSSTPPASFRGNPAGDSDNSLRELYPECFFQPD